MKRALVFCSLMIALVPQTGFARAGAVDRTFGRSGVAAVDLGGFEFLTGMAVQRDQKVLATGWSDGVSDGWGRTDFMVVRFTAKGALDRTFSRDGIVRTNLGGDDRALEVAQARDGKVVVGGTTVRNDGDRVDLAVTRYTTSGTLDRTFGNRGIATARLIDEPLSKGDRATDMALQADGKIVIGGTTTHTVHDPLGASAHSVGVVTIARFLESGILDPSFGVGGRATIRFPESVILGGIATQKDGAVIIAGSALDPRGATRSDMFVARVAPSGVLDPTFGIAGKTTVDFGSETDHVADVAVGKNGSVTAVGFRTLRGRTYAAAIRTTSSGALDPAFDKDGKAYYPSISGTTNAVELQSDGKAILGANRCEYACNLPRAIRLTVSGAIDTSFGSGGIAAPVGRFYAYSIGTWRYGSAVAIQGGKVLLGASFLNYTMPKCPNGVFCVIAVSGGITDLGITRFTR